MKKKNVWLITAAICLVLGIAASLAGKVYRGRTEGIRSFDIATGDMNQSLTYDRANGVLYVGTHNGLLSAWRDGEELWQIRAEGAFRELALNESGDTLYAANESNRVCVFRTSDGEELLNLDLQRKAVGVAVNADGSRFAVITNTGSSKSNLFVFASDGTEISNIPYKGTLRGIEYCGDGETLMLSDKRGDISHIAEDGELLNQYSINYDAVQMKACAGTYWVVGKNGSYYRLDEELNCLRSGQISNTVNAIVNCIGVDAEGEYVVVGSKEGYLFVMDGQDKQIYTVDMEIQIMDTAADEGCIYLAGYGDAVWCIYAENLENIELYTLLGKLCGYLVYVFAAGFLVSLVAYIPRTRRASVKLLKNIWKQRMAYIMLLPTYVLLFLFSYRGIFTGLIRAFTDWSVNRNTVAKISFIGLDNFRTMLSEGYFLTGMINLLLLLISNIIKTLTVPLLLAWLLYSIRGGRRKYIHRFLFVLPMVVPGVVGALVWQKIYDPSIGLLNQVLGALGLESLQRVWLGDAHTAMGAVIFMGFPFVGAMALLVYYAGFNNIGNEVIESALIDGGTRRDIFWRIQLPLIRPQISLMITLTALGAMQEFNSIYILTGGGPGTATYVPALELYLNAAQFGRYGYASALGLVLLVFTMTVTIISNRLTREKE